MQIRARPAASGGSGPAAADADGGVDDGREGSSGSDDRTDWPEFRIESSVMVPVLVSAGLVGIAWRGIRQILMTPGAPVGDDLSSHFAEISFFARSLRAGDPNLWFADAQLGYLHFYPSDVAPDSGFRI